MWVSIIEKSPNGIFITDEMGKYIYSNPAFTKITGYPKEDTPTLNDWFEKAFPDPAYRESVEDIMRMAEKKPKKTACLLENVCKNGLICEVEFRPFNLNDGARGIMLRDVKLYISGFKALESICHDLENYRKMFHSFLMLFDSHIEKQPFRIPELNQLDMVSDLSEKADVNHFEEIVLTIRSKIMPILKNLQKQKIQKSDRFCEELDLLNSYLNGLTQCLTNSESIISCLSCTEMRVATMIKNGMTSSQIAQQLNISPDTVKTHRRNIRKKLNIQKSDVNLRSLLKSKIS